MKSWEIMQKGKQSELHKLYADSEIKSWEILARLGCYSTSGVIRKSTEKDSYSLIAGQRLVLIKMETLLFCFLSTLIHSTLGSNQSVQPQARSLHVKSNIKNTLCRKYKVIFPKTMLSARNVVLNKKAMVRRTSILLLK